MLSPSLLLLALAASTPQEPTSPPAARPAAQEPADPAAAARSARAVAILAGADAIQGDVATICGHAFTGPVARRVVDEAGMRAYTAGRLDLELGDGRLERMEAWLRCLALLPEDRGYRAAVTELLVGQMAAAYDSEHRELNLLDDTTDVSDWYARFTIAHELAHALDDQVLGLHGMLMPPSGDLSKDQLFAVGGVVEGSAIGVSELWAARNPPPAGYDPMARPEARANAARANAALVAAPPYCTLLLGRHLLGRMFVAAGRHLREVEDGAYLGLLTIAKDLPASTEQLLHPRKYWLAGERDDPVVLADDPAVGATLAQRTGLLVVDRNTLGELIAALLAQPIDRRLEPAHAGRLDTWTNAAATGWGGDRLFLLGSGGGTAGHAVADKGVVWITAWDTAQDREEFCAAFARHRGDATRCTTAQSGRTAIFAFGSARTLDPAALAEVLAACRFRQGARDWRP